MPHIIERRKKMQGRLEGKVVLITGIGNGIGRAAALRFAQEGAKVIGCDFHANQCEETRELALRAGRNITVMSEVNLGDHEAATAWVQEAARAHDRIDVLYNNAARHKFAPIDKMSVEDWHFTIHNELDQVFYVTRAAWPYLIANGKASIINSGSVAGMRGVEFMAQNAHSAAKGGVIAFTLQLVVEGGKHGIRANVISPGMTRIPATEAMLANPPPHVKKMLDRIPLGRFGEPDDIVNVALFLASDESAWVTGANIVIDGGISALG